MKLLNILNDFIGFSKQLNIQTKKNTNNTKMDVCEIHTLWTLQSTMGNTHEWPEKPAHRHLTKAKNPIEPNNIANKRAKEGGQRL